MFIAIEETLSQIPGKIFLTDRDVRCVYQVSENLLMDRFMNNAFCTKNWFTGSLPLLEKASGLCSL